MLKKVLWIAAACAAVLVALAVSRNLDFDKPVEKAPEPAPVVEAAPPPPVVEAPVAAPEPPKPVERTPEEQQIQDDAAATGMTTVEPDEPPPTEAPKT
jgi:hypothetical protein